MDVLLAGYDELISLQTDEACLTVKGRAVPAGPRGAERASALAASCGAPYALRVCGEALPLPQAEESGSLDRYRTPPLLGETGRYEIVVESLGDRAASFWHRSERVRNAVTAAGRSGKILSGAVDFAGEIGESDLVVLLDGQEYLRLTIEVFPSTISYREEFAALSAGLAEEEARFLRELPDSSETLPAENAASPESAAPAVRELSLLYERWCFLRLDSLIRSCGQAVPVSQNVAADSESGPFVCLMPGRPACVRYKAGASQERITLSWYPRECDTPTGAQKPRCVLTLEKKGASAPCSYVFEPRYRLNFALPGTEYDASVSHMPGPEIGDIHDLHRYRDAMVSQNGASPYEREMFGAYVLFPYAREEEYRSHRFYESIDKVNVGGLPFLPGAVSLAGELIGQLIADSPASALERAALPRGLEGKLAKVDWSARDVLIGTLRNSAQLDVCLRHRFYYIPAERLTESDFPIHYVAIYQSRNLFGDEAGIRFFGEVTKCIPVRRAEIREFPCRPGTEDKLYYRFEIGQWKRRSRPIVSKEAGFVRSFTNLFLIEHSAELPELWIRSEEEYRLYCELKRAVRDAAISGEEGAPGFRFGSFSLLFDDRSIYLVKGSRMLARYAVADFSNRPGAVFRQMQRECARFTER